MRENDPHWIRPVNMSQYYVYALYDETGIPFYIGKGKGYRINNHVKPSNRKEHNHKNHKINKLIESQGFVKREILAYVSDENEAYLLEEWLIRSYGLRNDGGCLTNISKSRQDTAHKTRPSVNLSRSKTSVKLTEQEALRLIEMYSTKEYTQKQLSDIFKISETSVSSLLCGNILAFQHLPNEYKTKGFDRFRALRPSIIKDRQLGMKVPEILKKYELSKTHYYRIVKNGLVTDTSSNNLDNTA